MRIMITGSPGTGKTLVGKLLAGELKLELIDVKEIASGIKNKENEVDLIKLRKLIFRKIKNKKDFIIENHLLCEFLLPVETIFVLRTRPDILKKRLKTRGYSKKKLEENLIAEMLDYCTQKVILNYKKKPVEIETGGKTAGQTAKRILKLIKNKNRKGDKIDYSNYLIRYTKKGKF